MGCTTSRIVSDAVEVSEGIQPFPEEAAEEVEMNAMSISSNIDLEDMNPHVDIVEEESTGSASTMFANNSEQSQATRSRSSSKDIAMEDTTKALNELTELLGPDYALVRQIWLGDQSFQPLRDVLDPVWICKICSFNNNHNVKACNRCQQPRLRLRASTGSPSKVNNNNNTNNHDIVRVAINQAIEAASCPICLQVYVCPITLPCGHSICLCHQKNIDNNKCPICRQYFPKTRVVSKNFALARHIRSIVTLACLADPQEYHSTTSPQSLLRDAATRVGITKNDLEEYLHYSLGTDRKREFEVLSPRSVSNYELQSWWLEESGGQPKELPNGVNDIVVIDLPDC